MTAAYVVVLADEHPDRDEWVDRQAAAATPGGLVEISDDTYRGLWKLPVPERTVVHLFALAADAEAIRAAGLERVPGPPA